MPTIHLLIKGKVQGVFYRASAKDTAEELGLSGWIQNTPDGNVEAMATGTTPQLDKFITWCKRGPRRASVTEVTVSDSNEVFSAGFTVRR